MRPPVTALAGLVAVLPCLEALPKANSGLTTLEQEELAFMKSSLKREMDDASEPVHDSLHGQEKAIRKAYRNIARRFKRNIFDDQVKFEFQMRILNLAKEALMKGDGLGAEGWADEDEDEDENATKGPGRELPGGSRSSDDILKQIHGWQEFALEEGIRFDDPDKAFFIGHTQHGYRDAFAGNWSQFLREELSDLWPAASGLRYQVELDGSGSSEARAHSLRLAEQARQLARQALAEVAGFLHRCGGRDPPLAGPVPESGNTAAWVDVHLKVSRNLRALFAGHSTALIESCAMGADRETRAALLELNLESLERLSSGDGLGRADVQQELRNAHSAAMAARAMAMPLHCQESANLKRTALERLWEEYHFGPLVEEAYPCDACGLQGLSMFLEFHIGRNGELLVRRAEPDRTVLRGLRGLLNLQHVLARPAYMSSGASSDEATQHSSASWREAVSDVEEAVWKGIAFPELHTAAGQLMAELAKKGFQPEIIGAMMEHPPVAGAAGSTLPQGREPSDVQPPREPRFQGMSIPGYNMKPVQRYEERALRMWGDEEIEEHWDPVRLGLSYIDLTSACDLPLQVAMSFLSAALWMWRALELLGDNCGGDAWLDMYIFEDIFAAPPASKRLAMQYSLKRAIFELVDYAGNMAQHQLLPGARLAVQRISYLLLRKVTDRFGTQEDGQKVKTQLKRFFAAARVNPLWSPPLLPVADAVFIDILSGRLHSAFLEKLHESETKHVLPYAVPEYTLYEAALLGGSDVNVTFARYDVMGALLQDTHRSWEDVEAVLQAGHIFPQDAFGFVFGRRADPLPLMADFAAVRGLRIDLATVQASLLLARPSAMAPPLFSLEDVAAVMALKDTEPLALMLDPPAQKGAGMPEYPHHPFQRASVSPTDGGLRVEETLLQAALAVQQLASGTEVSFRPPFPTRPCEDGLCQSLPKTIREKLQPIRSLRTEAWDVPSRLVLECPRIPYWQEPSGNVMDIRFGDPRLEVHAGQPLRELNEEEFKKWPVGRLQAALNQVEKELGSNRQADLPALEKQELVDRLLRAAERGLLIEDDEETGEPLVRFSRRLTHHLQDIGAEWPHLARMVPFCALRAAGLILRMQLQQMNQSASEQQEGLKQASEQHAKGMQQQQEEGWRGVLAEVHAGVLRQQGFVDLDPMKCFESNGRSFGRCCSVGDYAEECWNGRGAEQERCCRGEARQKVDQHLLTSVAAQLGSVSSRRPPPELLIPAVEAWLRNPAGGTGGTNSRALISLLVEEVNPEELMKQQGHQVNAPVQKLFADLDALSPTPGIKGLVSSGQAGSETWLPVPGLSASGGRRALYGTVALSPQLVHLEPDEAQAAREHLRKHYPGTWVHVPMENLSHQVLQKDAAKRAALQAQQSPNLRAIYEATQLINLLDERTEDLEAGKVPTASRAVAQISECLTGWRELTAQEIQRLKRGSHLQLRRKHSEEPAIEVQLEVKLLTTGEPSSQYLIWEVSTVGTSELQYFDLQQTDLAVSAPCNVSRPREAPSNASESVASVASANASDGEVDEDFAEVPRSETTEWPGCIEAGVSRSLEGRGLFVNLGALGIERGCFQGDCSHSDHFEAVTPAECAKICKKISACRQWIFWEGNPSTCWLRQSLSRLRSAGGALSGSSACVPPDEDDGPAEPNLFSLITSKSGTVPPALWHERDLIGTLEEFGHLTLAEIKQKPSSMRQRSALRAAAEASATYRSGDAWLSR